MGGSAEALPPGASGRELIPVSVRKRWRPPAPTTKTIVGLVVAFFVALITYPVLIPDAGWELDQSWAAALHMANHDGLVFGRDLVFTYGPLGWLTAATMFYESTGAVAIAIRFPLLVIVSFVLWRRVRQLCAWPFALVATVAMAWLIGSVLLIGGESPLLVLFAVMAPYFLRLLDPQALPIKQWALFAYGALSAVVLLVKFDVGLYIAAWTLFMVGADWIVHRQRFGAVAGRVGLAVGGFVSALVVGWVACGQPIRSLGQWIDLSFSLLLGFNDAMAQPGYSWELQMAFASMVGLVVLVRQRGRIDDDRRRRLLWLALGAAMFVFAKQGFVRHDGHSLRWWAFVGVAVLIFTVRSTVTTAVFLAVPSVIVAGAVVGTFTFTNPTASVKSVDRAWGQVTSHSERVQVQKWGRTILPKTYPLPPDIVSKIQGKSVHIAPVRSVVSWVYPSTVWRPFPLLQHYDGFTTKLDRWTADFVRSKRAPQFVVYERFAIDGRIDRWEPPETMLALVCEYRYVTGSDVWQLFEKRPSSACGARRTIDTVDGRIGEEIYTPLGNDDEIVVGSFASSAFSPGPLTKLRWTLTRPPIMDVFVQGDPNRRRFVMGTAGQDHLLVLPECLRSTMAGFDTGTVRALTFTQSRGQLRPGASISARYSAIRFRCDENA